MEIMFLEFVVFLFSCDALRHTATQNLSLKLRQLVVLPAAGLSASASGASGSSQSQAVRTQDQVTPSASLLEANGSDPMEMGSEVLDDGPYHDPYLKREVTLMQNSMSMSMQEMIENVLKEPELHEQFPFQGREQNRKEKIIEKCIKTIANPAEQVCSIMDMRYEFTTLQEVQHFLGRYQSACLRFLRSKFNSVFSPAANGTAFELMGEYLAHVAGVFDLSPCRKACLAMCASKVTLEYAAWEKQTALYGSAEEIWDAGVGTCHEYAIVTVGFANKMGVTSEVRPGAGGHGNALRVYNGREQRLWADGFTLEGITDWQLQMSKQDERDNSDWICLAGGAAVVGVCSVWCAYGPNYATVPVALGTFLSYSMQHHHPVFSWGGHTYMADTLGSWKPYEFYFDSR